MRDCSDESLLCAEVGAQCNNASSKPFIMIITLLYTLLMGKTRH